MNICIVESYREMSDRAADIIVKEIKAKHNTVLGLATGSTPEGMYSRLVSLYRDKRVDFSGVVTFNLDEYAGLSPDHEQSYHYYMYSKFFNHVNVKPDNVNIPTCQDNIGVDDCEDYDQRIREAGGIDIQVLGIGVNGHIGFNEPCDSLKINTHLVELKKETIEANSRFFKTPGDVPRQAITMGIGSIMYASRILLLASGENKSGAVGTMCSGQVTTGHPASLLQLHHDVTLLVDREAAALIEK